MKPMSLTKREAEEIERKVVESIRALLGELTKPEIVASHRHNETQRQSASQIECKVREAFTEELQKLFSVKYKVRIEDFRYVELMPKRFIGDRKLWNEIWTIVAELGGEYISEGKTSHFEIPVRRT